MPNERSSYSLDSLVLFLSMLSGVAGIAYEVLYIRLFAAYFGDIFYVSAILIAAFFIGIAIGSYVSRQYAPFLKYIEIFIGLYGLALAILFKIAGLSITAQVIGLPMQSSVAIPFFVFLMVIVPASAIGFGVPLFALYVKKYRERGGAFSITYAAYNIGAAIAVIAVEYGLVHSVGISAGLAVIASINLFIGISLFLIRPPQAETTLLWKNIPYPHRRVFVVLGLVSVLSGILQINTFNLFQRLIGPLNENIALLIGAILLSIALASWYAEKRKVSFFFVVTILPFSTLASFILLHPYIIGFSYLATQYGQSFALVIAMRCALVLLVVVPAFAAYGLTIPAVVREYGIRYSGIALAVSAMGNAIGYLLYIFLIFRQFGYASVILGTAIAAFFLWIWLAWKQRDDARLFRAVGILFAMVCGIFVLAWPSYVTRLSYVDLYNVNTLLDRIYIPSQPQIFKKYGNDAIIVNRGDSKELILNGYRALIFNDSRGAIVRESLIGIIPAFFIDERDQVLVFGLGSGVTVSAAADMFKNVRVAEINPAMLGIAQALHVENENVLEKKNVSIDIQDGLITLLESTTTYDAIINSVTSPLYFSANKLWTKDVFDLASSRLSEHGVFVGWIDMQLSRRGFDIMTRTLEESFDQCVYLYLNTAYLGFVCANHPLIFHPLPDSEISSLFADVIRDRFLDAPVRIQELIRGLLFAFPTERDNSVPINTLDTPFLESAYAFNKAEQIEVLTYIRQLTSQILVDPFTGLKRDVVIECLLIRIIDPRHVCAW